MPSSKSRDDAPSSTPRPRVVGGLAAGLVEMAGDQLFQVRTSSGTLVAAALAPGCDEALVRECMRDRRTVLVAESAEGPQILGALQTTASTAISTSQGAQIEGQRIEVQATDAVVLRAGSAAIELRSDGTLRIAGSRLAVDVATLVKIMASRVELP